MIERIEVTWGRGDSRSSKFFEMDSSGDKVGFSFEKDSGRLRIYKNTERTNVTLVIPAADLIEMTVVELPD